MFLDTTILLKDTLPIACTAKDFTSNEVKNLISKNSSKKSPGFDLITCEVACYLPNKAIVLLTYIFNYISRLSNFPLLRKLFQIIMFVDPRLQTSQTTYRPINLLPYFFKNCERLKR